MEEAAPRLRDEGDSPIIKKAEGDNAPLNAYSQRFFVIAGAGVSTIPKLASRNLTTRAA